MTDRAKRPAYQWYPGDARRDTALSSCPLVVRGLWREMLDLMHDGAPYGHLTAGGVPITEEQLARMVGESVENVRKWLRELEVKRVFSRTGEHVIFSRRMVRDERIRSARASGGKESLKHPNVPRPKRSQGSPEGYPCGDPCGDPSGGSFRGSPAVAVASALHPPPPACTRGCEGFLASLPPSERRDWWEAEIATWREGLNLQQAASDADINQALTDYLAQPARDYSKPLVRSFVQRATRDRLRATVPRTGTPRSAGGRRPTPQQYAYDTSGNAAALAELGITPQDEPA